MKAFVFGYQTNYDLGAVIVYAESKERAVEVASKHRNVWSTENCHEIDLTRTYEAVITIREDSFIENEI